MAVDRAALLPGQELMEKLDQECLNTDDDRWQQRESRIREDERGAQAEHQAGFGQQHPEYNRSGSNA
jgi:hypothetical protein